MCGTQRERALEPRDVPVHGGVVDGRRRDADGRIPAVRQEAHAIEERLDGLRDAHLALRHGRHERRREILDVLVVIVDVVESGPPRLLLVLSNSSNFQIENVKLKGYT